MGSRPKTPEPSREQRHAERLQLQLLQKQLKQSEHSLAMPAIQPLPPQPLAPPPPSQSSADVLEAMLEQRRQAKNRINAGMNTLFAGETGRDMLGAIMKKTLLG